MTAFGDFLPSIGKRQRRRAALMTLSRHSETVTPLLKTGEILV
jgi:hypothetical protein